MKERPILFSGPMVRAILEGRKTVTRRVMKHQPHEDASVTVENYNVAVVDRHGEQQPGPEVFGAWWSDGERGCVCPYGQPGDRLWVRETYADAGCRLTYKADVDDGAHCVVKKWTPSIHMPRRASRILLEITDVRVERLQDISEEQAIAEGIHFDKRRWFPTDEGGPAFVWPQDAFQHLFQSVTGGDESDANPWVWVVEFERVTP
ncbi:hypothetical protein [Pseudomonas nitroreducens]|uniref:hypothetical protein n=1 Tax=Pseudomonas nitroreducens TaxID=46680 RepID=UPI003CC83281